MKRFTTTVLSGLLTLMMLGFTQQTAMAGRGRPEPVIIIVE